MQINPFSSQVRPAIGGRLGAISAAHPLAVTAGQRILSAGGSAVDALIAAQAALAVVSPDACGLGGDGFMIVAAPGQPPVAVNGSGSSPSGAQRFATTGGASVAVPGLVDAWMTLHCRWGRLDLAKVLAPAIEMANGGIRVDPVLAEARRSQADRLLAGGAAGWGLMVLEVGQVFAQPLLVRTLERIASGGRDGFYGGEIGGAIARAVARSGGAMTEDDLAAPAAIVAEPLRSLIGDAVIHVQPPASQGILLAMALDGWRRGGFGPDASLSHRAVELTQAAFTLRDEASRGAALLTEMPDIDPDRAQRRGGPRAYLHTAGVAASDATGLVASSLVSVFDDFGSAVFVPEGGFTLNNRMGGFTSGLNAFEPGKRPIHTLAPALVIRGDDVVALSTPGADGQVQTLLQVILAWLVVGRPLPEAVAAPRWRSEDGRLLVEQGHPDRDDLAARGHDVVDVEAGDVRFGAVTAAGTWGGAPFALADWRRMTWAGVA